MPGKFGVPQASKSIEHNTGIIGEISSVQLTCIIKLHIIS